MLRVLHDLLLEQVHALEHVRVVKDLERIDEEFQRMKFLMIHHYNVYYML